MDAESQLLAAKDAEIERLKGLVKYHCEQQMLGWKQERSLKAELEQSRRLCQVWIDKSARQDKLITELCDALAESDPFDRDIANSLIQRAREAAK